MTADFLDLVASERDRRHGVLAVLLCDDQDRLDAPVVMGGMPEDLSDKEREHAVPTIVGALDRRGSVLVAVARRSELSAQARDHAWGRAAARACADGPRLLAVHVVTLAGSREVSAQAAGRIRPRLRRGSYVIRRGVRARREPRGGMQWHRRRRGAGRTCRT